VVVRDCFSSYRLRPIYNRGIPLVVILLVKTGARIRGGALLQAG
jgi:hypothetical protein